MARRCYADGQAARHRARVRPTHWRCSARRSRATPTATLIRYFDGALTLRRASTELTDAFAVGLLDSGFSAGDRVARLPAERAAVRHRDGGHLEGRRHRRLVNPMNQARELRPAAARLGRQGAGLPGGLVPRRRGRGGRTAPTCATVITTSELEYQARDDARILGGIERMELPGTVDMAGLIDRFRGQRPPSVSFCPDDTAFLTYTSGTTGPPKGAMNTHGNVVFNCQAYRQWCGLGAGRRRARRRTAVPHHRPDRPRHALAAARRAAGAVLPLRARRWRSRRSARSARRSRSGRSRCSSP